MKKFLSLVSSRNRHSLYAQIILSAFLQTTKRMRYMAPLSTKLQDYPSLAELFDENFIDPIIDKIMANGQMSWPLVTSLEQLNATQQLDREQFRALIDKLIQEQWAEQLLGASLYRTLLEQLEESQEDLYQVVIHILRSHGSENDEQSSLSLPSKSRGFFRMITPMGLNVSTSFSQFIHSLTPSTIRDGTNKLSDAGLGQAAKKQRWRSWLRGLAKIGKIANYVLTILFFIVIICLFASMWVTLGLINSNDGVPVMGKKSDGETVARMQLKGLPLPMRQPGGRPLC